MSNHPTKRIGGYHVDHEAPPDLQYLPASETLESGWANTQATGGDMPFYALIDSAGQIEKLERINLKGGLSFFFALFFKSDEKRYERNHLMSRGVLMLFVRDGVVHVGNTEGIAKSWGWEKIGYDDFVGRIKL